MDLFSRIGRDFLLFSSILLGIFIHRNLEFHINCRAVYIGYNNEFWKICQTQEDFSCTYDVRILPNPKHHSMSNYLKAILAPPTVFKTKTGTKKKRFQDAFSTACYEEDSHDSYSGSTTVHDNAIVVIVVTTLLSLCF